LLAPTGRKGDRITADEFAEMLPDSVNSVTVVGCKTAGFAERLNELKPEITTQGMSQDLYDHMNTRTGVVDAVWMGDEKKRRPIT
jgi:hypothetical protein